MTSPAWHGLERRLRDHPMWTTTALVLLVFTVLFASVVFRGSVFYFRDIHLQWQPQVEAFVRAIASGSAPFWNPYFCFGQPLWANPNNQLAYPLTWLNLLMPTWDYYVLYVLTHFLVAGLGMYLLAVRLGLPPVAARVATVVWIASGPFVSLVNLWNHLAGASWIPWGVLAADLALASGRTRYAVLWGASLAAPILAGSPESALMTLAASACALRHLDWRRLGWRERGRRVLVVAGAAVLSLGLSAAQWIPSSELARRSVRGGLGLPAAHRTYWSIPPAGLLLSLTPVALDPLPLRIELRDTLFEGREPFLQSLYLGLAALVLVPVALLGPRRKLGLVLFALVTLGALTSTGRHTPFYGLLDVLVPPVRALRFPAKAMVLAAFAWSLLVGLGLDAWRRAGTLARAQRLTVLGLMTAIVVVEATTLAALSFDPARWGYLVLSPTATHRRFSTVLAPVLLAGATMVVLGLATLWMVLRMEPKRRGAVLVAMLVGADLLLAHRGLTPTAPRQLFTVKPPLLRGLVDEPTERVYSYDYFEQGKSERYLGHVPYLMRLLREDWPAAWTEALALRYSLYPSVLGAWAVEGAFTLDGVGMFQPEFHAFNWLLRAMEGTPTHLRLLQMGATARVVALHRETFQDLTLMTTSPSPFHEPLLVFRVPDPLPRVYLAGGVRVAKAAAAFDTIRDPAFDPRREIILEEGTAAPVPAGSLGSARILSRRPDRVVLEAEATQPAFLVLLDGYDPGWRATLDGQAVPVLRANLVFRALRLPPGRHQVEYVYRPRSITIGLIVSAASVLLGAGLLVRRREGPGPATPTG